MACVRSACLDAVENLRHRSPRRVRRRRGSLGGASASCLACTAGRERRGSGLKDNPTAATMQATTSADARGSRAAVNATPVHARRSGGGLLQVARDSTGQFDRPLAWSMGHEWRTNTRFSGIHRGQRHDSAAATTPSCSARGAKRAARTVAPAIAAPATSRVRPTAQDRRELVSARRRGRRPPSPEAHSGRYAGSQRPRGAPDHHGQRSTGRTGVRMIPSQIGPSASTIPSPARLGWPVRVRPRRTASGDESPLPECGHDDLLERPVRIRPQIADIVLFTEPFELAVVRAPGIGIGGGELRRDVDVPPLAGFGVLEPHFAQSAGIAIGLRPT